MIRRTLPLALSVLVGAATAQERGAASSDAAPTDGAAMNHGAMDHGSMGGAMAGCMTAMDTMMVGMARMEGMQATGPTSC